MLKTQFCWDAMVATLLGLLIAPTASEGALVTYAAGNIQYTNVNVAADTTDTTIVGEVGNTGINVYFQGFSGAASGSSMYVDPTGQLLLHGQHGVAFVEAVPDANLIHPDMFTMTITAQAGWGFRAFDLKLDEKNGYATNGNVSFYAYDSFDKLIAGAPSSLSLDANGQNPYNGLASADVLISRLVIVTTPNSNVDPNQLLNAPILDLKQVSLDVEPVVPEPASLAIWGIGALGCALAGYRRRKSA